MRHINLGRPSNSFYQQMIMDWVNILPVPIGETSQGLVKPGLINIVEEQFCPPVVYTQNVEVR